MKAHERVQRVIARGGIVLFVLVALEVVIMISPFAFFFYSVFSPLFNWFNRYAATRWLTAFFLPHMILPPTFLLQAIRVLGSVLFVVGMAMFVVCALQIYIGKLFRWGVASKGLYRYIRHPQYLALGLWGVGMSVLWPRFIVLVTLSIMFVLYRYLARDEEARMRLQYGKSYEDYACRTGRFFPRFVERGLAVAGFWVPRPWRRAVQAFVPAVIVAVVVGAGFVCRAITLSSLPFASRANITLVPILPEDVGVSGTALDGIVRAVGQGQAGRLEPSKDYLGYLMPPDYIMQGMIADTGESSHLYHQHKTVGMITDWVLHPFEHLRRPPSAHMAAMYGADPAVARRHHCPLGIDRGDLQCDHCPYRRVILLQVTRPDGKRASGSALLAIQSVRVPVEVIDMDARTGRIVKVSDVGKATAWKDVPTPGM